MKEQPPLDKRIERLFKNTSNIHDSLFAQDLQQCLDLSDDEVDELMAKALEHLLDQEYGKAYSCFLFLAEVSPFNGEIFLRLGNAAFGLQKYEEALEAYGHAAWFLQDDPFVCIHMAHAYEKLGNVEEQNKALLLAKTYCKDHGEEGKELCASIDKLLNGAL